MRNFFGGRGIHLSLPEIDRKEDKSNRWGIGGEKERIKDIAPLTKHRLRAHLKSAYIHKGFTGATRGRIDRAVSASIVLGPNFPSAYRCESDRKYRRITRPESLTDL